MRVFCPSSSAVAVLVAALCLGSARAAPAAELRLNGWYPCGFSSPVAGEDPATTVDPQLKPFECAEADVPLCYEGVCDSDRTISLFVKRLVANATEKVEVPKSLWMLQGGPGGSSVALETSMLGIHRLLQYQASMYTVDHRGTGRSFFLQCDAAQAFASGSPSGVGLGADEVPDCLRDILFQIDNQTAAFSVTSAAMDVAFLAENLHDKEEEVYVYGASYGTYLTERVMHLAPSNVKGYILDGVMAEDRPSFTTRNADNITPTKRLASYCEASKDCASMFGKFKKGELYSTWQAIYDDLDALKAGENDCADLFRYSTLGDAETEVSSTIKATLGPYANDNSVRPLIPGLLKLIHRCQDVNDLLAIQKVTEIMEAGQSGAMAKALHQLSSDADVDEGSDNADATDDEENDSEGEETTEAPAPAAPGPRAFDVLGQISPILSLLIKASELWTYPSPSFADEMEIYYDAVLPQPMVFDYAYYCLYRGNMSDPSCQVLDTFARLSGTDTSDIEPVQFTYETDEYYGKFASIPDHASALIINGKLDFQTMSDNGVHEYENLEGGRGKMMVEMDYGGHCSGISPYAMDDKSECGFRIIASFVKESGNVENVDTNCLEELPELLLWPADYIVQTFAPTDLISFGDSSAASSVRKATKTKTKLLLGN